MGFMEYIHQFKQFIVFCHELFSSLYIMNKRVASVIIICLY